jgi:hypothetical protein
MGTTTTDDDAALAQREAFRAAVIARESGGQNVFSRAGDPNMPPEQKGSGYYQFIPSSWREAANMAGIDTSQYPLAINAPRELQDKAFDAYYGRYGQQPWAQSAPGTSTRMPSMSTTTTDTTGSGLLNVPAAGASDADLQRVLRQMNMGQQTGDNTQQTFLSKLGAAFGGGQGNLTGQEAETAGLRSLMSMGMGLLANSGWHPVRTTMGQALAAGMQDAMSSEAGSQNLAFEAQKNRQAQVLAALGVLNKQQEMGISAQELGVKRGQLGVSQQQATTSAGQLAVQQAEERRKQTETDIELQRQKQLLAAPPLFPSKTAPVAPVAPSAIPPITPPTTTPPAGSPAPVQSDQLPSGGGGGTAALTPPGGPSSLVAGPGVPATTQPPASMPQTPADVAAIVSGMKDAGAKDMGGTQVAQAGGTTTLPAPAMVDGSKPFTFQMPPVPAEVSPDLTDDQQANLAERYRLALLNKDPAQAEAVRKDMQALQTEQRNKFLDWRQKTFDAQHAEWLQANKSFNDITLAEKQAGLTAHQKQADQDMTEGNAVLKSADTAASSAAEANTMLTQLGGALSSGKLPPGIVAQFMTDHPDITNFMKSAGFISGNSADMVQLINGMNAFMSTRLRQAGSGQLRNLEMQKFQGVLPTWLETEAGQKKALAFLMNMNDRTIAEADYSHEQFRRPVLGPDGKQMTDPQTGRPMLEYNIPNNFYRGMEAPAITDAQGNRTGGGLGAVLPHYDGPMPTNPNDTAAYDKWVQSSVKAGRPYYGLKWDSKNNRPVEVLDVRPGRLE